MPSDIISVAPDRELEIIIEGEGRDVLVYHHGTPAAGPSDPTLVNAAARAGFRLVQVVRPGYGRSTRQPGRTVADVSALTKAAVAHVTGSADTPFVSLGWSGGGPHALATAALIPTCAAAVSFAGVGPFDAADLDFLAGMGQDNIDEFGAAVAGMTQLQDFMEAMYPAMQSVSAADINDALASLLPAVDREFLADGYAEALASSFRYSLAHGYWGWADDDIAFTAPWGFALDDITVPVHIWQGADDLMVPVAHGQWLAENIPAAVPHLLEGEGHLSLAARFDEVLADLRTALDAAQP